MKTKIRLGKHSYAANPVVLFSPQVKIGRYTSVAEGTVFMGSVQHPSALNKKAVSNFPFYEKEWGEYTKCGTRGDIVIGHDVWIGSNVIIMDNVHIGNGAIIGAGAVVAHDIPEYGIAVGNPAQVIKKRFPDETIEALGKIAWWYWSDEDVKKALPDLEDIDRFINKYKK